MDTLGNHVDRLSLFQRNPEVFNGRICFFQSSFQSLHRQQITVIFASGINLIGNILDLLFGKQFGASLHDTFFNQSLLDSLLVTDFFLCAIADVVVIFVALFAGAGVTCHHFSAITTEQFGGKKIFLLTSGTGRRSFVSVKNILHSLKQSIIDVLRHTPRRFFVL